MKHPALLIRRLAQPAGIDAGAPAARGFTLIEILLVIVVIGILSALGLAVTNRVVTLNRARTTENLVRGLDQLMESYVASQGAPPPAIMKVAAGDASITAGNTAADRAVTLWLPMADGRYVGAGTIDAPARRFPLTASSPGDRAAGQLFDRDLDPPQPSAGLFLLAVRQALGNLGPIQAWDSRFLIEQPVTAWGWRDTEQDVTQFGFVSSQDAALRLPIPRDAWGRPIRFVHPAFQGGFGRCYGTARDTTSRSLINFQDPPFADLATGATGAGRRGAFSRSARPFDPAGDPATRGLRPVGDADEGSSSGRQGYFYSAGASGNPGDRRDNVYSAAPSFPPETQTIIFD